VNADPEPLTARIRNARFRTTRWDGYDEREVDNFLDDAVQALRRGQPDGDSLVNGRRGRAVGAIPGQGLVWPGIVGRYGWSNLPAAMSARLTRVTT